ncbi:hypothetical protein BC830DRAFT_570057 [Chytriomyces sp. MP71]|nr:hypothetical protein BC830DRAFT_570057 [Chytriomyces sp. MP71]
MGDLSTKNKSTTTVSQPASRRTSFTLKRISSPTVLSCTPSTDITSGKLLAMSRAASFTPMSLSHITSSTQNRLMTRPRTIGWNLVTVEAVERTSHLK